MLWMSVLFGMVKLNSIECLDTYIHNFCVDQENTQTVTIVSQEQYSSVDVICYGRL